MKNLILLICLIAMPILSYCQFILESLEGIRKNYSPLFSKESATVNFEYIRTYTKGQTDTNYAFLVAVSYQVYEEKGVSSSFGYAVSSGGRSAVGFGSGTQYELSKSKGEYYMNLDTLKLFIDMANRIYVHANAKHTFDNLASDAVGLIGLAVEVKREGAFANTKFYYLRINDAAFLMTEENFTQLMMMAIRSRDNWTRAIQASE